MDETQKLATESDDVYHFIAYTCINGKLYEIDGLQPAPIFHGNCTVETFPEEVIPVLQRRINRYPADEIRFNLLAMVGDLRVRAKELGDGESLAREDKKREAWLWENALRRHNFVEFSNEVLKAVVTDQVKQETYEKWLDTAQEKTNKRIEENRKKGVVEE